MWGQTRFARTLLRADVNVTPMIDVMLVLLIIFMIVTPVITSRAALPRSARAAARPERPGEILLTVDRNGVPSLAATGGAAPPELSTPRPMSDESLGARLGTLYAGRTEDRILYLKADSALPFGRIETLIDIARRSGVRVVGAVTERRRCVSC